MLRIRGRRNPERSKPDADVIDGNKEHRVDLRAIDPEEFCLSLVAVVVPGGTVPPRMMVRAAASVELDHAIPQAASLALNAHESLVDLDDEVVALILSERK
ncbi:MAG TPA: hypothetical protein VGB52_04325 [Actinomycetota bacterium]